jgi:hypothetical protein
MSNETQKPATPPSNKPAPCNPQQTQGDPKPAGDKSGPQQK